MNAAGESGPIVAVDGFGLDRGPGVLAEGVRAAAADGISVRVFGSPADLDLDGVEKVEVVATEEWIDNNAEPVAAVRSTPGASIVRAVADVAQDRSAAVVSNGSTGATMAAATFGLRRMKGVQRPALAARVPVPGRAVLFLDIGANTDVRAQHLVQFAYLGAAFSQAVLGVERPEVGLLSVGEEPGKGTESVVEANARLRADENLRFVGNVEGNDLTAGRVDVVVSGGFVGNIALKSLEGAAKVIAGEIRKQARSSVLAGLGGLAMRPSLRGLRTAMSPDSTGGAILLGLRGIAVVGHGSAGPDGVANAIRLAARSVEVDAPGRTADLLRDGGITRRDVVAS